MISEESEDSEEESEKVKKVEIKPKIQRKKKSKKIESSVFMPEDDSDEDFEGLIYRSYKFRGKN